MIREADDVHNACVSVVYSRLCSPLFLTLAFTLLQAAMALLLLCGSSDGMCIGYSDNHAVRYTLDLAC